jgi:hypothetical protein
MHAPFDPLEAYKHDIPLMFSDLRRIGCPKKIAFNAIRLVLGFSDSPYHTLVNAITIGSGIANKKKVNSFSRLVYGILKRMKERRTETAKARDARIKSHQTVQPIVLDKTKGFRIQGIVHKWEDGNWWQYDDHGICGCLTDAQMVDLTKDCQVVKPKKPFDPYQNDNPELDDPLDDFKQSVEYAKKRISELSK